MSSSRDRRPPSPEHSPESLDRVHGWFTSRNPGTTSPQTQGLRPPDDAGWYSPPLSHNTPPRAQDFVDWYDPHNQHDYLQVPPHERPHNRNSWPRLVYPEFYICPEHLEAVEIDATCRANLEKFIWGDDGGAQNTAETIVADRAFASLRLESHPVLTHFERGPDLADANMSEEEWRSFKDIVDAHYEDVNKMVQRNRQEQEREREGRA